MRMRDVYQPAIILELIRRNGAASRDDLAIAVWRADPCNLDAAIRVLMRWPKRTLTSHGVVSYDSATKSFHLTATEMAEADRIAVEQECLSRISAWVGTPAGRVASLRFRLIDAAEGRCQACGAPGFHDQLDVDHVVPRSYARNGQVRTASGEKVPVDDERNLQVLCVPCNRGKADRSTTDFRPSLERLARNLCLLRSAAADLGYSVHELEAATLKLAD